jgi:hypothetical protein
MHKSYLILRQSGVPVSVGGMQYMPGGLAVNT